MKKMYGLIIGVCLLLLGACNSTEQPSTTTPENKEEHTPLHVFTTVYPLQYFAEQIGGEAVRVESIYPPGTDEHSFDPTQKDMMRLADADLFFYIGLGLESFVDKAKSTLAKEDVQFVATGEMIDEQLLEESHHHDHDHDATHDEHEHHDHGEFDPHVWISPVLSKTLATSIKEELIAHLPEHREQFEQNYQQIIQQLDTLDQQFEEMAHTANRDTFFVSHAAFGYIADRYHLHQVAVAGLNSQSEPSQKQLAALVQQAKEENIQYVLFEQNISSSFTEVIQKEIGAEALTLHNLAVLTDEDLAQQETYFTLMERNIEVLRQALQ